jgi:cytochrome c2
MRTLVILIISLFLINAAPINVLAAEANKQIDPAQALIQALGCKGCHTINKNGGTLAPDLTQIGSRMTAAQIHSHLVAHSDTQTKGFAPSYSTLNEQNLKLISQYLYNLR